MINLLPLEEKEKILLEFREKIMLIICFLLLFSLFSFISVLFLINFYIQKDVKSREFALEERKKDLKMTEFRTLEEKIAPLNSELLKLNDFYQKQINFSEIIGKISSTLPQAVYLTNLSFVSSDSKSLKVGLSGFSPNREILFELKNNLEKEKNFQEVYFPQASWVKSNDIDFSLTFNGVK